MHIKFLKHGTGAAKKAAAYVLAEMDHQGIVRADVQVLRGNPDQVAALADSLPFVHRYTSCVISWAPEDKPTPDQIEATLDQFEALAFAGLESDRYAWTAVLHREQNGAVHIHTLNARVDLATGKSLNIAPPGWQADFDPLRDALNWSNGWARPDDPARARLVQPGHQAFIDAAALRNGLQTPTDAKKQITEWLAARIASGKVADRTGVLSSLKEIAEITRVGKDYISIKLSGFDKAIRLKGAVYGEEFAVTKSGQFVTNLDAERGSGQAAGRGVDRARAAEARNELDAAIRRRADYNRRCFATTNEPAAKRHDRKSDASTTGVVGADTTAAGHHENDRAAEGDISRRVDTDRAIVAMDAPDLVGEPDRLPVGLCRDLGLLENVASLGSGDGAGRQGVASDEGQQLADVPRQSALPTIWNKLGDIYDRVGAAVSKGVGRAWESICRRHEAFERASADLVSASERLEQSSRCLHQAYRNIDECIQQISRDVERGMQILRNKREAVKASRFPGMRGP